LWSIANKILNRANCKFILIGSINLAPKLFKLIFKESKLFFPVGKRRGKMNFYTDVRKQKNSADISFNLSPGNHPIRLAFQVKLTLQTLSCSLPRIHESSSLFLLLCNTKTLPTDVFPHIHLHLTPFNSLIKSDTFTTKCFIARCSTNKFASVKTKGMVCT